MAASTINNIPTVEFVIMPKEDLYLFGPQRIKTLKRIDKDTPYPCIMQKPQSFSSMFRHYAKHNGLDKTTLRFFFVEELQPEQTPESVALMPHDVIYVSHSVFPVPPSVSQHSCELADSLRSLLNEDTNDLSDVTFRVGSDEEIVRGHKAILCARSTYFAAMFRPGGMLESTSSEVRISGHSAKSFKKVLEYIYTCQVKSIKEESLEDIFDIICLASEYMMNDLQSLCENTIMEIINIENVCKCFTMATKVFCSPALQDFCQEFVIANIDTLRDDEEFRNVVKETPDIALVLLDHVSGSLKKRKRSSLSSPTGSHVPNVSDNFSNNDD